MASPENQLSRYGAISKVLPLMAPNAKVFFIGASTLPSYADFAANYPVDKDGGNRIFATLNAAIADSNVVASRGDVLLALPGHTESVASAAATALTKAGLTIIGLGDGSLRPTVTFTTATTATMTISAANIRIENFIFNATFDAVVSPIVVSAAGVTFKNCYFETANASAQVTQMILTTAAANNFTIDSCRFSGTADAGNTAAVTIVGGDNLRIVNSDFHGAYTTTVGAIQSITTLNTNCVIKGNTIINRTASSAKAITLLTGSTGIIADNRMGILTGTAPIGSDAAYWSGNYYAAAVATAGTLV